MATTDSSSSISTSKTAQDLSSPSSLPAVYTAVGVCASFLIMLLFVLFTVTILLVWRMHRKSAIQEYEFEQVDGSHPSAQWFGGLNHSIPIFDNEYQQTPFPGDTLSSEFLAQPMGNIYAELPHIDSDPIYSRVDVERPHQPREQDTIIPSAEEATESISTDAVYAVVNKSKKKTEKQLTDGENNLQGPPVPPYNPLAAESVKDDEQSAAVDEDNKNCTPPALEGMYATVNKKQKEDATSELEEECSHLDDTHSDRVNELCTVVKQEVAETSSELEDEAQSKVMVEELYTVVKKKPKAIVVEEEEETKEEVPPIPPYTTERLSTTSIEETTVYT